MRVDLWRHFKAVLTSIWPFLPAADKQTCNIVVRWVENQGNYYTGINPSVINQTKEWLKEIRDRVHGQVRTDLTNAITFLTRLNLKPLAGYYTTQAGCSRFGFYWYDNACNESAKRIPAPPLPPPVPPPPPKPPLPDDPGIGDLLTDGGSFTIEYTNSMAVDIANNANRRIEYWNEVLGGLYAYADIVGALEYFTSEVNDSFDYVEMVLEAVFVAIGDTTQLQGKSLVEAILESEGKLDKGTQRRIDYLLDELKINYNEEFDSISYTTTGMWGDLKAIITEWEDQGQSLTGIGVQDVADLLSTVYKIQVGTIDAIYARLDKIEKEIGISIEHVTGDIVEPVIDGGEGLEYFTIASVGWVKDQFKKFAEIVIDVIEPVTVENAEAINFLLEHTFAFSDQWLERLKEKLGNVAGEYSLVDDPIYEALSELVKEHNDIILELPEWWISSIADKLKGYFTVGIGEKGEKGDPGVPGARGIQGIPGVKGDPGEPGEGVGLAIDDIDRQLKDRLVTGSAIVTTNVTGVIDYNIGKIGELFTRYDLEVKPITDFLTTDMQSSLTDIVEAFGTPEALIAYLLDVPEGEEEGMLALMQILISQTMERGVYYELE